MSNLNRFLRLGISVLLIAALLFGILPGPLSAKPARADGEITQPAKGDVTGDGLINGRDVLKLQRILEGLDAPSDSETFAGDVFPLYGLDSVLPGDGQLTADDLDKLLRSSVGLVSQGEISADYQNSVPVIDKIEPMNGSAGNSVEIFGGNFIEEQPQDNLVFFGDVPGIVISSTGTKLVAEVPPGAESGYITVITPGGQAKSLSGFIVTSQVSGQLALPGGLNPTEFNIISPFGEASVDSGGGFSVTSKQDDLTFIGAAPKSGGENIYLNMLSPGTPTRGTGDVEISPLTTAKTLVWLQPQFLSDSLSRQQELWNIMDGLDEITALATVIETVYPTSQTPLEDERVTTALDAAATALFNALPADYKTSLTVINRSMISRAADSSQNPSVTPGDTYIIEVKPQGNEIEVGSISGNPLDWVIPNGLKDSQALLESVYDRYGYSDYTTVSANFWSLKIALVTSTVNYLMGLAKPDTNLTLSDAEDAVYVLRAYSGTLIDRSPGDIDSATLDSLKALDGTVLGMNRHEFRSLATNLIQAMLDTLDLLVSTEGCTETLVKAGISGFEASFTQQFPYGTEGLTNEQIVDRAWIVINDTMAKMMTEFMLYLKDASWKTKLMTVFKSAVKKVAVFEQISTAGKIAERVAGLAGTSVGALVGEGSSPTPLESAFIVVGDPFAPKIENFSPKTALGGTELVITGKRFAETIQGNKVVFGTWTGEEPAEILSAAKTELRVKIPSGNGIASINVETSLGSSVAEEPFIFIRTPKLSTVSPAEGFAATDNFAGAAYSGDVIRVEGSYFSDAEPHDRVTIGGVEAVIVDRLNDCMDVRIPAGITGGTPSVNPFGVSGKFVDVKIIADETGGVSNPMSLLLIDPPGLDSITPDKIKGNDIINVTGANFPVYLNRIKVLVRYGSTELYLNPLDRQDMNHLRFTVYSLLNIPAGTEGTIQVVTPAGVSAPLPFQMLAGLAGGASIPVHTTTMVVVADSQISLAEAVLFATGKENPQSTPWDDSNLKIVEHWYQGEPYFSMYGLQWVTDWVHEPEEDEDPIELGVSDYLTQFDEYSYFYKKLYYGMPPADMSSEDIARLYPHGAGAVYEEPEPYRDFNLDSTVKEEGDYVYYGNSARHPLKVGAGYSDKIAFSSVIPADAVFDPIGTLVLDTGYDESEGFYHPVKLTGGFVLDSDGNSLINVNLTNPNGDGIIINGDMNLFEAVASGCAGNGITINGNDNALGGSTIGSSTVTGCTGDGIHVTGDGNALWANSTDNGGSGIKIVGGSRNVVSTYGVTGNGASGLEITGGAQYNIVSQLTTYGNYGAGVYIHGTGTSYNNFNGNIGNYGSSTWQESYGDGIYIADGASYNTLSGNSVIAGCAGNGIVVTGDTTVNNRINGRSYYNGGYGIHVTGGAKGTIIFNDVRYNGKHNVLIDGNAADTVLRNLQSVLDKNYPDDRACIRIIGNGQGQTNGTFLQDCQTSGGTYGLWVTGVAPVDPMNPDPSLTVAGMTAHNAMVNSLRLDGGTSCSFIEVNVTESPSAPMPVKVIITGENTAGNHLSVSTGSLAFNTVGVHVTDGAHDNIIMGDYPGISFSGSTLPQDAQTIGILIDNGSHHNRIEDLYCQTLLNGSAAYHGFGVVTDQADHTSVSGRFYYLDQPIVLRNSTGNTIEGCYMVTCNDSILLDNVHDTVITGMSGSDKGINGVQTYGIRITGQSSGISVHDTSIRVKDSYDVLPAGEYGIIIDGGSHDISIGTPVPGKSNSVGGAARDGILIQGPDTKNISIVNTRIGVNYQNTASGNLENGISIKDQASQVNIGGRLPNQRNLIVNNGIAGISFSGSAADCSVTNNCIGITDTLIDPMPNATGIILSGNTARTRITDNYICYNTNGGIVIDSGACNNQVLRNLISLNGNTGVEIDGAATSGNTLRSNTISMNDGAGILLSNGANNLIPAPVIDEVSFAGGRLQGYIDSGLPRGCIVDVFADSDDEGEIYLGTDKVYGNRFSIRAEIPSGYNLHAIVTDPNGNTSEFGPYIQSQGGKSSPAGYVFTSTRNGNPEVYIIEPGETVPTRLTNDPAPDHSPQLSPDGSSILFVSERNGLPEIWAMDRDGSNQVPLITGTTGNYDPAWSPDGSKFAFTNERDGNPQIYLSDAPGYGTTTLAYDDGTAEAVTYYGWPNDIQAVRFASDIGKIGKLQFYIFDNPAQFKWVILTWNGTSEMPGETVIAEGLTTPGTKGWHTVDLGNIEVPSEFLVGIQFLGFNPQIGRDTSTAKTGRNWIYLDGDGWYLGLYGMMDNLMIRVVSPIPDPIRLSESESIDCQPAWSPDGTKIAFTSDRSGNRDIWVMNADGTSPVQVTDNPAADSKPAWSPDGSTIAFVTERDGNKEIYTMSSAGVNPVNLSNSQSADTDPAWTSDGSRLLFASDRQGGTEIYSILPDSSKITRWTTSLGTNSQPHASFGGIIDRTRLSIPYTLPGTTSIRLNESFEQTVTPDVNRSSATTRTVEGTLLTIESKAARNGTAVSVNVTLSNALNLGCLAFDITYDKSALTLTSITPGIVADSGSYAVNPENFPSNTGIIRGNWVTTAGFTGNGTALTLHFTVSGYLQDGDTIELPVTSLMVTDTGINEMNHTGIDGTLSIVGDKTYLEGLTREANGQPLSGVTVSLDDSTTSLSDAESFYRLTIRKTGTLQVTASKTGYRDQQVSVGVANLTDVHTFDFKGDTGLIPSAPDISYALACINKWIVDPADGTGLTMPAVLAVINAWKFPIP